MGEPNLDRILKTRNGVRIGLISDTHMPQRCDEIPAPVFEILRNVDLVLHAGDVGELWALDQLSEIAAVVAVHGNDEGKNVQSELPYQQVVTIAGHRILLWHSHFLDRDEELEQRGGAWGPKLDRLAKRATQVGANIVIFGHTHIPMCRNHDGVLVINPGALQLGGPFTRQTIKTIAVLELNQGSAPKVSHIDIANPEERFLPAIDIGATFEVARDRFEESILTPELQALAPQMMKNEYHDLDALATPTLRLSRRCWLGKQEVIKKDDLLDAIKDDLHVHPADQDFIITLLSNERMG